MRWYYVYIFCAHYIIAFGGTVSYEVLRSIHEYMLTPARVNRFEQKNKGEKEIENAKENKIAVIGGK